MPVTTMELKSPLLHYHKYLTPASMLQSLLSKIHRKFGEGEREGGRGWVGDTLPSHSRLITSKGLGGLRTKLEYVVCTCT